MHICRFGEQTYCRKDHFDKMPKVLLHHFADFFLRKAVLVQNAENFFFLLKAK